MVLFRLMQAGAKNRLNAAPDALRRKMRAIFVLQDCPRFLPIALKVQLEGHLQGSRTADLVERAEAAESGIFCIAGLAEVRLAGGE